MLEMALCSLVFPLQVVSAIAAVIAAAVWGFASVQKSPPAADFAQDRVGELNGDILDLLRQQSSALASQSRLNAWAAGAAAIAAICQLALAWMPSCSAWGS
jgi:hypothetical protein